MNSKVPQTQSLDTPSTQEIFPRTGNWLKPSPYVYKSGNKKELTNYRPISLTSTCCKILGHVILKHISTFVVHNNIITPFQHGFRRRSSTVTRLTESIHDFSTVINNSGQVYRKHSTEYPTQNCYSG